MIGEPELVDRSEQPYVAIRTQVRMQELGTVIPRLVGEVLAWLAQQNVAPAGAPFIRYLVIDMDGLLDVEIAAPVASPLAGDGRVCAGVLPAGRYASLVYIDIGLGIPANRALLQWGAREGLAWEAWRTEKGEAFGARVEIFLTGPDDDPDPKKWQTQVAIKLAS